MPGPGARVLAVARTGSLVLAALLATACQVDVAVDVEVAPDETGQIGVEVALDAAAAAEVPDLAQELEVDDLRRAGWTTTVSDGADGGVTVRAVRSFESLEEATAIFEQVGGPDGPVSLELDHRAGVRASRYSVAGEIDLTDGLAAFTDAGLRDLLGGSGVGVDDQELEQRAGRPLAESVTVRLEADLPGRRLGPSGPWEAGPGTETVVAARSQVRHDKRVLWALGAAAAAVTCGLLVVWQWVRGRREGGGEQKAQGRAR